MMNEKKLSVYELIESQTADDDKKGDIVYKKIMDQTKDGNGIAIILDFSNIELLNTAFLNNAIGKLFKKNAFDFSKNRIRIINIDETMVDLVQETIAVARERYAVV